MVVMKYSCKQNSFLMTRHKDFFLFVYLFFRAEMPIIFQKRVEQYTE